MSNFVTNNGGIQLYYLIKLKTRFSEKLKLRNVFFSLLRKLDLDAKIFFARFPQIFSRPTAVHVPQHTLSPLSFESIRIATGTSASFA
jgi:hypothetical protein